MGKPLTNLQDPTRPSATKHRYSADERELGTDPQAPVPPLNDTHVSDHSNTFRSLSKPSVSNDASSCSDGALRDHISPSVGEKPTGGIAFTTASTPAPPQDKSKAESSGHPAIDNSEGATAEKLPLGPRLIAGCKRFGVHMKHALTYSWLNLLLIMVPVGIAVDAAGLDPSIVFAINAVAIVPLAGLLAHATETVASHYGANIGALLNVTFGNAVELIIFIVALIKNEVAIIQAALLGSILSNLLLILGMAFLLGGLRYREQVYNSTVTQMSACLLTLAVASLVLPTAFHASFNDGNVNEANLKILEVSRGTSVILLLIYVLYLVFQLKSHAYMYEATPQHIIDEESHPGVLHSMLNDSSSSSSSDTDSDSSSDSSNSHSTAGRRLRRLIKNRRRRKSSASTSTAGTTSMPSISSPSGETRDNYFDGRSQQGSGNASPLGVIVSGDEADADEDNPSRPRVRDFVNFDGEALSAIPRKKGRKHYKQKYRNYRKHRHAELEKRLAVEQPAVPEPEPVTKTGEVIEMNEQLSPPETNASRRPFNLRAISSRGQVLAPSLSKILTNNVFMTPPPVPTAQFPAAARVRADAGGLRRTASLPDRLNQQESSAPRTPGPNALQPTTSRRTPAPHVRIAAVVGNDDTIIIDKAHEMSRTAAIVLLLCSTALVAVCAEFMVSAIPIMVENSPTVSEAFIGLIVLPIVGNAAEHVTAVTVAAKNKMDLAIGVAVGSSIQIALFVTPLVVLLGWIMKVEMTLYFNIFETVSLFVAVLVVNFLCLDGRSNYLEGALLIAAYVIIALVAFYYPQGSAQSALGGGTTTTIA